MGENKRGGGVLTLKGEHGRGRSGCVCVEESQGTGTGESDRFRFLFFRLAIVGQLFSISPVLWAQAMAASKPPRACTFSITLCLRW